MSDDTGRLVERVTFYRPITLEAGDTLVITRENGKVQNIELRRAVALVRVIDFTVEP